MGLSPISTRDKDAQSGGLACVHVDGLDVPKLQAQLWTQDRIITTPIVHAVGPMDVSPLVAARLGRTRLIDNLAV